MAKKKAKIRTLKRKLWSEFSKYIKHRDQDTCITCSKFSIGKGMHAGHFIPKRLGGINLYFDERNVHAQCFNCNINNGGWGAMYYKKMLKKYNSKTIDQLFSKIETGKVWNEAKYLQKIEYYKKKNKGFENETKKMAKRSEA